MKIDIFYKNHRKNLLNILNCHYSNRLLIITPFLAIAIVLAFLKPFILIGLTVLSCAFIGIIFIKKYQMAIVHYICLGLILGSIISGVFF